MKIALVHHQLKLKGGMETYLFNLIDEFQRQNDAVKIHVYKKVKISPLPCEVKRYNLFFLPHKLKKFFFGWLVYKNAALQTADIRISLMRAVNQNIIICGGTHRGYLMHTNKKPGVFDKHEIKLEQAAYQSADLVVAHSRSLVKELLMLYQIPPEKIVCIYPPIDSQVFNQRYQADKYQLRQNFGIPKHKTVLLFPSTGHERKGIKLILEALQHLPVDEYQLVIAGNTMPHTNLPNCTSLGFVEDMALAYTIADVTVLPSYYEPFGLVAIESIQCGTPVILSKFVGATDLIEPEQGIILPELSVEHLVSALQEIRQRKFSISKNFAEQHALSLEQHVKQLKTEFLKKNLSHETKKATC